MTSPALPSYRNRYIVIVFTLAVLLGVIAVLAYRYSVAISERSSADAAWREIAAVLLDDAFRELSQTRRKLQNFLLLPGKQARQQLDTEQRSLNNALARLASHHSDGGRDHLASISLVLLDDAELLDTRIIELVDIRDDPRRWFPANHLIEEAMQPRNAAFRALIGAIISDLTTAAPDELKTHLYDLRKDWLRSIDEVRLIIANRFGAHADDPLTGMAARAANIEIFTRHIGMHLDWLQDYAGIDEAVPLIAEQTEELRQLSEDWHVAYTQLYRLLRRDDWRADLSFLRSEVDPLMQKMQKHLDYLRVELQAESRQQVETLGRIGRSLSGILFAALALMIVLGVIAYFTLDRLILRPIRLLTENFKRHAEMDASNTMSTPPVVRETNDLVTAFVRMQELVRERERKLDHMAHHDPLTGLPNRTLLRRRLSEAISTTQQHQMLVGLLFIDLDRFKQVNDSHGHSTGDKMLIEISERLLKVFRQDDLVARLGGDEFAVLLENVHAREEMTQLANKALSAIQRPYRIDGRTFHSGASIGIAVVPDDGTDPDRLLQQADTAMYAAKRDEGSSFRYVSNELTIGAAEQHALENELRDAVNGNHLELHFQPVCRIGADQISSYEALLRWPHAEQGLLHPAAFMEALADAGLCTQISDWVLDNLQVKSPSADAIISINLSARLLHDESFAERLFSRIDSGRLIPQQLVIEITEDTLETDLRAATRVLHELKLRGVRIALDDFGTGKASLSHLRRFPFDYIKIDQSFVAGIGRIPSDEKLIQAIIGLAHALDMEVVAEGVETEEQLAFLAKESCDLIQGYLIGKPAAGT